MSSLHFDIFCPFYSYMCVFEIFLKQFNTLKQKEQKKLYETFWDHQKKIVEDVEEVVANTAQTKLYEYWWNWFCMKVPLLLKISAH